MLVKCPICGGSRKA